MTLSTTGLINLAFLEVPCASIVSISDNVYRAEVARLVYPQVIKELMELEWSFSTTRAVLTSIPNSQPTRWGHAFAIPNGMGFPLHVRSIPDLNGYLPQEGQLLGTPSFRDNPGIAFDIEGGTLWADSASVELEYVDDNPSFSYMAPSFEKAVTFMLAARLVYPITKDEGRRDKAIQMAEVYRDRALASDLNRDSNSNTYGNNFVPEVIRQMWNAPES